MANKVFLLGRLGADPEVVETKTDTSVTKLRLATTERRKGADGEWSEGTEWHNIVCFGRTAENVAAYTAKGKELFIEGSIRTRKWEDRDGNARYSTEIVANNVHFIGPKVERQAQSNGYNEDSAPF